jgi:chromate transporter
MNASEQPAEESHAAGTTSLKELALLFLRLGTTAFGGPAAHIAIMEDEFVRFSLLAAIALSKSISSSAEAPFSLHSLFLYFLKIGSVLYGSGYVLLAFLQTDLVNHWHWLSASQLLDATAMGQVTPGPVFTTATFIGYLLGSWPGALIATAGIFLPAFVFIAVSVPIVSRLRESPVANAFLDGVNVASLALMAVVTWRLGRAAIIDPTTILLAVAGGILLVRYRVNSAWLVLGGAIAGIIAQAR